MYNGLLKNIVQDNEIYWTIKIYSLKKIKILDLTIFILVSRICFDNILPTGTLINRFICIVIHMNMSLFF